MSAASAVFVAVRKAFPFLAKQLPKLWPLLLDSKNREKINGLVRDLAASSPNKRLAAKMGLTDELAAAMASQAANDVEREQASEWQRRAQKMRLRLDMPVEGLAARRRHRASLHDDLATLHAEMSAALSS